MLFGHALRHAAVPVVTVIGYNLGFVLAGSALIETVFAWPGIGQLIVASVFRRDYPMVQGALLLFAATFALINFCVDMVYGFLDPRIRYG